MGASEPTKYDKVITDISRWRHPTKAVFRKQGHPILEVRLVKTYPYFIVGDMAKLTATDPKTFYDAVCRANYGFSFAITDSKAKVRVTCNRKRKTAVKWD